MKTVEMEYALAVAYDYRRNLVVPNVHWGMQLHECDLLLLTEAGYATEIEIKISMADLRKDKEKKHGHRSGGRIKKLIFAMPHKFMSKAEEIERHVPGQAGIVFVEWDDKDGWPRVHTHRQPIADNKARAFTQRERYRLARLGALRIWNLKRKTL